jgi:hypothetical protein
MTHINCSVYLAWNKNGERSLSVNLIELQRRRSWPITWYYPDISLDERSKTTESSATAVDSPAENSNGPLPNAIQKPNCSG